MKLDIYQVDAFADKVFEGNPAAIIPLTEWLPDEKLQAIAAENNLAETAYFLPTTNGFHLRWFTPTVEVPLCGHATLASAFIIYSELGYDKDEIVFKTQSGPLVVRKKDDGFAMDFPANPPTPCDIPKGLDEAIGAKLIEAHENRFCLVVCESEEEVRNAKPDFKALGNITPGDFILTAKSEKYDFVSRCFAPTHGIDEDPVTGSAHCVAAPFWAERLGKTELLARQVSSRGGNVLCSVKEDRVELFGRAILYLKGEITLTP
ncbi:PhzF family phenazine biosynthesis protein [Terasakiella sp. A23]|uniref:PhzF family phenazine biosynthesis protein n=1 Tax=Terasakiella sp. FCG-A23 TaxID=3080561 RepID=UPI002953F61D|nr:PhzF family phenazine biosynthesis protein [Terasakiella sp. A23]MDV7338979.1 PhzF family phenazine biosynthesis protein [Terasakiella sp. A23]